MAFRRPDSLAQLIASEMRERVRSGAWRGELPGMLRLSREFSVSRETVEKALAVLTREGVLEPPRHGLPRRIAALPQSPEQPEAKPRRVGWLAWRPLATMDRATRETISEVIRLAHAEEVELFVAPHAGSSLKHPRRELAALTTAQPADAWIVQGGTLEMAQWFAAAGIPALAVGGRVGDTGLAQIGFDMGEQIAAAVRHLAELGHRRIILPLPPQTPREGPPSRFETAFRRAMESTGLPLSADYNLPHLDGTLATWHRLLEDLFALTPPTAFILYNGMEAAALAGFLQRRGRRVPDDVSLVVEADEPMLEWLYPEPSRIEFSSVRLARGIWKWLRSALSGRPESVRRLISGTFSPGRTTAPPPHAHPA